MAMALVPAVLTLNVSPCSFSVAVDTQTTDRSPQTTALDPARGPDVPLYPIAPRAQAPTAVRAAEATCAQRRLDNTRVSIYDDHSGAPASSGRALS